MVICRPFIRNAAACCVPFPDRLSVGVSLKTVYSVKKAMTTENGIERKSGSGGSNKIEILYFMMP